jgi:hypothetical protein
MRQLREDCPFLFGPEPPPPELPPPPPMLLLPRPLKLPLGKDGGKSA